MTILFILRADTDTTRAIYREVHDRSAPPLRGDTIPFAEGKYQVEQVKELRQDVSFAIARASIQEIDRLLALQDTPWKDLFPPKESGSGRELFLD